MMFKSLVLLVAFAAVAYSDPRLKFVFYHGTATSEFDATNLGNLFNHPSFQKSIKTIFFHYNAGQTTNTVQVNDVINSYMFNRQYNFVVVDYEDNTVIGTDTAVDLAEGIATSLISLFEAGYASGEMNLLGFSLGAQILARASRRIQAISNSRFVVGRLTGLDPSNLGPISGVRIGRLSAADAQWVESVHTESPNRGDHGSFGHVHFYINGGASQPQCTSINPLARWDCSHNLAMTYWAESVRSPVATFPALQCSSWELFQSGGCNSNSVGHMGRTTEANLRGAYHLRTNLVAPFARNSPLP